MSYYRDSSVVLMVDLSTPNDLWVTMEALLGYLTNRVEQCLTEAARRDSQLWEKVKAKTKERLGGDHPVRTQLCRAQTGIIYEFIHESISHFEDQLPITAAYSAVCSIIINDVTKTFMYVGLLTLNMKILKLRYCKTFLMSPLSGCNISFIK